MKSNFRSEELAALTPLRTTSAFQIEQQCFTLKWGAAYTGVDRQGVNLARALALLETTRIASCFLEGINQEAEVKTVSADYDPVRTTPETTAALHELLRRIESEYREMPGMCVTQPQAQRLWGLDSTTCSFVLTTLIERGVLRQLRAACTSSGKADDVVPSVAGDAARHSGMRKI